MNQPRQKLVLAAMRPAAASYYATSLELLGDAMLLMKEYHIASRHFAKALEIRTGSHDSTQEQILTCREKLGKSQSMCRRHKQVLETLYVFIEDFIKLYGSGSRNLILVLYYVGKALFRLNQNLEAQKILHQAVRIATQKNDMDDIWPIGVFVELGSLYIISQDFECAERYLSIATAAYEKKLDRRSQLVSVSLARCYQGKAAIASSAGEHILSKHLLHKSLQIYRRSDPKLICIWEVECLELLDVSCKNTKYDLDSFRHFLRLFRIMYRNHSLYQKQISRLSELTKFVLELVIAGHDEAASISVWERARLALLLVNHFDVDEREVAILENYARLLSKLTSKQEILSAIVVDKKLAVLYRKRHEYAKLLSHLNRALEQYTNHLGKDNHAVKWFANQIRKIEWEGIMHHSRS